MGFILAFSKADFSRVRAFNARSVASIRSPVAFWLILVLALCFWCTLVMVCEQT
jgi:hypothetical protein